MIHVTVGSCLLFRIFLVKEGSSEVPCRQETDGTARPRNRAVLPERETWGEGTEILLKTAMLSTKSDHTSSLEDNWEYLVFLKDFKQKIFVNWKPPVI